MNKKTFKAALMSGHKGLALEVPFNPSEVWGIDPVPLWRGRRGHNVKGRLNGLYLESCIVPRQKKFYLLIDTEVAGFAGVSEGTVVRVAVEPCVE